MNSRITFLVFFIKIAFTLTVAYKSYDKYAVYNVVPKTQEHLKVLQDVEKSGVGQAWDHYEINHVVKVMVAQDKRTAFVEMMKQAGLGAVKVFDDVQKLIENQLRPAQNRHNERFLSLSWDQFYNLDEINTWLEEITVNYPDIVTSVTIGQSNEGRDIKGIVINYKPNENDLHGMLEGAVHAREWISPATVTWIIKEFLTSNDPEVRYLAEHFEWHIFPVINVDGYVYTFTNDRMWRKNRNTAYFTNCTHFGVQDEQSNGVDLNRNFGFEWMTIGASSDPCSNTFAGSQEFSEPESRALAQYVQNIRSRGQIIYYLAFHSYTQLVVVPYSHVTGQDVLLANNYGDMFEIASRGVDMLKSRYGTQYTVGVSADVMCKHGPKKRWALPRTLNEACEWPFNICVCVSGAGAIDPMSGTSFDWVKYAAEVPVCYLLELRDRGEYGFLLPPEQIIPNNLEVMDFIIGMDLTTHLLGYYHHSAATSVVFPSFLITICVALATMLSL